MVNYYVWTIGCQMNKAESEQITDFLDRTGHIYTPVLKKADIFIVNTCVVRQNAEDKVTGMLSYLKGIKKLKPDLDIIVTGCFVDSNIDDLYRKYPHVSLFYQPGNIEDFYEWMETNKHVQLHYRDDSRTMTKKSIFSMISIIQGCNNYCSYCIVPYRRGRERSRRKEDILTELQKMAQFGVIEVTLTGQNVNSYGKDLYKSYRLIDLLEDVNNIDGLLRIRFLTNHPKDMDRQLIEQLAGLNKVCKHINIPVQSGDNEILRAMNRQYTREDYLEIIDRIKKHIPGVSLSTDIIVGFPGESEKQFRQTVDVIRQVKYDVVHVAMYSPRRETVAFDKYQDDISVEEKKDRFNKLESIQESIARQINSKLLNKDVTIIIEGKKNNKYYGRTASNKLVFVESPDDLTGQEINVKIVNATAWSLQAEIINK
jgi:tRNA-2-methylthio-N6-dimethylallyladenosine synthase